MAKKDSSIKLWLRHSLSDVDKLTSELWGIFQELLQFWERPASEYTVIESRFDQFVANRIECNPEYIFRYLSAIALIKQMELNATRAEAIRKLCTDLSANVYPPNSELARAKHYVVNEFAKFYMSVGGFKMFDEGLRNHPGFIGGMNMQHETPYITYKTPEA